MSRPFVIFGPALVPGVWIIRAFGQYMPLVSLSVATQHIVLPILVNGTLGVVYLISLTTVHYMYMQFANQTPSLLQSLRIACRKIFIAVIIILLFLAILWIAMFLSNASVMLNNTIAYIAAASIGIPILLFLSMLLFLMPAAIMNPSVTVNNLLRRVMRCLQKSWAELLGFFLVCALLVPLIYIAMSRVNSLLSLLPSVVLAMLLVVKDIFKVAIMHAS